MLNGSMTYLHLKFVPLHPDFCFLRNQSSLKQWLIPMLLQYRLLVAQLFLNLCDPIDFSPPGSSVHRILQGRILEWVAIPFSKGSSQPRDQT